jgi:hypothetical protein
MITYLRVVGVVALAFAASSASAGIAIVSQSAKLDRSGETASFVLTFNQNPDFSPGAGGIPVNSFQYEVDASWTGVRKDKPLDALSAVVRGDEIPAADALRIRSADLRHPDPDPAAGGWGPVRGTVPFQLSGKTLTFTAPLAMLGDDDGVFAYRVFATNAGMSAGSTEGHVVPLPMGALTGGAGLAGLIASEMVRRRRAADNPSYL